MTALLSLDTLTPLETDADAGFFPEFTVTPGSDINPLQARLVSTGAATRVGVSPVWINGWYR